MMSDEFKDLPHQPDLGDEPSKDRLIQAAQLIRAAIPLHEGNQEILDERGKIIDFYLHAREYQTGDETIMVDVLEKQGIDPFDYASAIYTAYKASGNPLTERQVTDKKAFDVYRKLSVIGEDFVTSALLLEVAQRTQSTIKELRENNRQEFYSRYPLDRNSVDVVAVYRKGQFPQEFEDAAQKVIDTEKYTEENPSLENDMQYLRAKLEFGKMDLIVIIQRAQQFIK